jgi:hypothetical protein
MQVLKRAVLIFVTELRGFYTSFAEEMCGFCTWMLRRK